VPFTLIHAGTGKYRTEDKLKKQKLNNPEKANNAKHSNNKTTLIYSPFTTLGQEMRWAYSTTLPSHHGACVNDEQNMC